MVCDPDTDRQGTGADRMHRTRSGGGRLPCLFCDRAGMHLANGRGTDDLPETAFSILCNRGHGYAGSILSGIKTDSETLQAFADRL